MTNPLIRALRALAVSALVATLLAMPPALSATAATTWSPTATGATPLAGATLLGPASPAQPLHVSVGLALRDKSGLDRLVRAEYTPGSSAYGTAITPSTFVARFAPTRTQLAAVTSYLSAQGFSGISVSANRMLVSATGTVATAERAFHTSIARYRQGGRVVYANTTAASVPSDLAGTVRAVLGLNNLRFTTPIETSDVKLPLTGYRPPEFAKIYHARPLAAATATSIAVIAAGDVGPTIHDLRYAESKERLPQVPVTVVHVGPRSGDRSGVDEWDLDTQASTGMAHSVKRLYIYDATSLTDQSIARAIHAFVAQDVAKAGSASLGECDAVPFVDGSMQVDDAAFEEAAAQGQTFFASTGDTGSSCAVAPTNGVPMSGAPDTEYPASSTWVTAVGGTTLVTDSSDHYTTELAWNAGGGGASPVEYPGWWQRNADPAYAALSRGVPDIAMDADLTTGALIYVGGSEQLIGGTSLSSPLALGAWARIETAHRNRLGNASPLLYRRYNRVNGSLADHNPVPGFHDVVVGGNGTYVATPGWDFTTGIGSLDVAALSSRL